MAETTESIPHLEPQNPNELPHMSDNERDRITEVFKMYETDVRSAAMRPEVSNTLSFPLWVFKRPRAFSSGRFLVLQILFFFLPGFA